MQVPSVEVTEVPDPSAEGVLVVDVREPHEWAEGHIDGALHIPLGDLPQLDGYEVRRIQAVRAAKDYVCPDCGNPIPAGVGHVVAWPEDASELRRHWHHHCWRVATRRGRV